MKLRLIKSYKKSVVITDVNGQPVIDELGREKRTLKTNFMYGIVGATVEEKREYKNFRNRDGEYYREDKKSGTPLYHSNTFLGHEAQLDMWENEDGEIGFTVDTTNTDVLESMMKDAQDKGLDALAQQIGSQIVMAKMQGKKLVLSNNATEVEEESNLED